ncbi:MAG: serine/threonine-protein kinase [Polyangiaceae bacterium]
MEPTDLVTQRAQARVGTLLNGRWHLDKLVGVGGMAAVYFATHRNTKRVAIKVLHPEMAVDENARQRFLREGYAANQVGHSGAVAADDDGVTEEGVPFLVMELLEGETLEERALRHGGKLSAREVLALLEQALATLEAAHARGIVHRDLKPENLFLTRDGVLKILDFGIARVQESAGTPSQTLGVMGTPSFMAPEQARGRWQDVDARTDLWALGATMFTLLSGRFVHQAETVNEALVMAVTERAPSSAKVVVNVHPSLAELVDKALAYERELRFQTASEFREAVHAVHQLIAGDDSLPALGVPHSSRVALPEPSATGLTMGGGVAASVRSAQTELSHGAKTRSKTALLAFGLGGLCLLGFVATRLVHGEAKRAAYAEPTRAAAAPAIEAAPLVQREVPVSVVSVAAPAGLDPASSAFPPISDPPGKAVRPAATRAVSAAALAKAKPHAAKVALDPFVKRH